jgi:hypothetical protein
VQRLRRLAHTLERTAIRLQRRDDRGQLGVLGDLPGALEIDAANGDQRYSRLLRR